MENALDVLGVSDEASFGDILRARKSIMAACKDDQETVAQVEGVRFFYFVWGILVF